MNTYTLIPQDLLFFRDARPAETSGGHGARWPEPSIIFDALHAALWRAFPDRQPWEHWHDYGRSSHRPRNGNTQRFGALATAGPFPVWKESRWLFPAPADATPPKDAATFLLSPLARDPSTLSDQSNLPPPLRYPVANFSPPTKDTVAPWWTAAAWQAYLQGQPPAPAELFTNADLFAGEWVTGIAIDPATQTTGRGEAAGKIYSAEYLRLRPDVRCGFLASLRMKQNGNPNDVRECIGDLFAATRTIIVGGQQRPCQVEPCPVQALPLPRGLHSPADFKQLDNGKYAVKWTLLSPAIWPAIAHDKDKAIPAHPGGWLPNWICPQTGKVLLRHRTGQKRRVWDEHKQRTVRKADSETDIAAHLVAAVVPKPIPVVGWTERLHLLKDEPDWANDGAPHGPRATLLAVPAGAVYYFEADTPEAAAHLAAALNWHGADTTSSTIRNRRSTLLGEKGYGLGVCGTWRFHP
jgi:hypothetical protein